MKSKYPEHVKNSLIHLLANLSRNSSELLEKWSKTSEDLPDNLDKAVMHAEMDFAFTRLFRDGVNKESILRALRKVDEGTYGICEECEEEIPIERLNAVPDATYCIVCQMALEREQKMVA
ncbi:MAG: TraR/DksA family transcriptional regulator [Desulfatirhabdiaceae bacterium]